MIITEYYMTREDGVVLERTYSDRNVRIENEATGEQFDDVVNPENSGRAYRETEIAIEQPEVGDESPPPFMMGGSP